MRKLHLKLNTILHLRPIQIRYQFWYRIRHFIRKIVRFNYPLFIHREGMLLSFSFWIEKPASFHQNRFTFLNIAKEYRLDKINWDEPAFGKLWAYNLNYMDYLLQPGMTEEAGFQLIERFINDFPANQNGKEPYPIALRGINWIKFFSKFKIQNSKFNNSLYAQYRILLNNLEYHLLGNHLLEDGFSLLFGGFYFSDDTLYNKGKEIIQKELEEQILDDGAHFELSPMYHQILLDRLLDSINLLQNNQRFADQQKLLEIMKEKAIKMLSWLNTITFSSGEIPLLNDAAPGIAPSTQQLNEYADRLNIRENPRNLSSSGYRKFTAPHYECIVDVGPIGPAYQPGHAHADTFNFVLHVNNQPVIVDTGISTYETNAIRLKERGTAAHNTVTINDQNSSEVWSSFRVAQRAKVHLLHENTSTIKAQHDGYRGLNTIHQREWIFGEKQIEITDTLVGTVIEGKAHILLSPDIIPLKTGNAIKTADAVFQFEHAEDIRIITIKIPLGYNQFTDTHQLEISFKNQLNTVIIPI